ncbi:unnamed protein product [Gordionus sp. m RMFG-2023]
MYAVLFPLYNSEQSIVAVKASVMLYDDGVKKWTHCGTCPGISKVQVYHHSIHNSFRVVGRKINDHEVVINCCVLKNMKYNKATPTFHQWRDQKQVYGLNFASAQEADNFSDALISAVSTLNSLDRSPVKTNVNGSANGYNHAPSHNNIASTGVTAGHHHRNQSVGGNPSNGNSHNSANQNNQIHYSNGNCNGYSGSDTRLSEYHPGIANRNHNAQSYYGTSYNNAPQRAENGWAEMDRNSVAATAVSNALPNNNEPIYHQLGSQMTGNIANGHYSTAPQPLIYQQVVPYNPSCQNDPNNINVNSNSNNNNNAPRQENIYISNNSVNNVDKNNINIYGMMVPRPPPLPKVTDKLAAAISNVKLKTISQVPASSIKHPIIPSNPGSINNSGNSRMMQEMIATLARRKQRLLGANDSSPETPIKSQAQTQGSQKSLQEMESSPSLSISRRNCQGPSFNPDTDIGSGNIYNNNLKDSEACSFNSATHLKSTEVSFKNSPQCFNNNNHKIENGNGPQNTGNGNFVKNGQNLTTLNPEVSPKISINESKKSILPPQRSRTITGTVNSVTSLLSSASSSSFSSVHSAEMYNNNNLSNGGVYALNANTNNINNGDANKVKRTESQLSTMFDNGNVVEGGTQSSNTLTNQPLMIDSNNSGVYFNGGDNYTSKTSPPILKRNGHENLNGFLNSSLNNSVLETMKFEIITEMRKELQCFKTEILNGKNLTLFGF